MNQMEYCNYIKRFYENYYSRKGSIEYKDNNFVERRIMIPTIVGENCKDLLIEYELDFPKSYPCLELKQVDIKVKNLNFVVCNNKVFLNGIVSSSIDYKVYEGKALVRYGHKNQYGTYSTIKNISSDLEISTFVDIVGAKSGDKVEIVFAGIEDGCVNSKLNKSYITSRSKINLFRGLKQSLILKVCVRVLRQTEVSTLVSQNLE